MTGEPWGKTWASKNLFVSWKTPENKILLTAVENVVAAALGTRSGVYSLQEFCSSLCHNMVSFCLAASLGSKVDGGERLVVSGVSPFLSSLFS